MQKQVGLLVLCVLTGAGACGGDDGGRAGEPDAAPVGRRDAAVSDAKTPVVTDAGAGADARTTQGGEDAGADATPDPVLPDVKDCTTEEVGCISASAIRDGKPLTCTAGSEGAGLVVVGGRAWSVSCVDDKNDFTMELEFPVQQAGAVSLMATRGSTAGLKFGVSWFLAQDAIDVGDMNERSSNLQSGTLTGTVAAGNLLKGTLVASWGPVGANCVSGGVGSPCKSGALKATFNVAAP